MFSVLRQRSSYLSTAPGNRAALLGEFDHTHIIKRCRRRRAMPPPSSVVAMPTLIRISGGIERRTSSGVDGQNASRPSTRTWRSLARQPRAIPTKCDRQRDNGCHCHREHPDRRNLLHDSKESHRGRRCNSCAVTVLLLQRSDLPGLFQHRRDEAGGITRVDRRQQIIPKSYPEKIVSVEPRKII